MSKPKGALGDPLEALRQCVLHERPIEFDQDANMVVLDGRRYPCNTETRYLERENVDSDIPYRIDALAYGYLERESPFSAYQWDAQSLGIPPVLLRDRPNILAYLKGERTPDFLNKGWDKRVQRWVDLYLAINTTEEQRGGWWQRHLGDPDMLNAAMVVIGVVMSVFILFGLPWIMVISLPFAWTASAGSIALVMYTLGGIDDKNTDVIETDRRKRDKFRETLCLVGIATALPVAVLSLALVLLPRVFFVAVLVLYVLSWRIKGWNSVISVLYNGIDSIWGADRLINWAAIVACWLAFIAAL